MNESVKIQHPKLVRLLQLAYSAEKAAAFAYIGHAGSVKNPDEKVAIKQIERDEWQHRETVLAIMGSYGVGVSRAVACVAEGNHDEIGLVWPREVAPADVHLVATGKDEEVFVAAESLARELSAQGVDVLLDDRRGVSPGVKFKDSELIGVPTIVVVGRGLASGTVELKDRRSGERREIALTGAVAEIIREIRG